MKQEMDQREFFRRMRWMMAAFALWGLLLVILAACGEVLALRYVMIVSIAAGLLMVALEILWKRQLKNRGETVDDRLSIAAMWVMALIYFAAILLHHHLPDTGQASQMRAGALFAVVSGVALVDSLYKKPSKG